MAHGADPSASDPLVSVVIVTHDNWPDLELAITSALCQSYRPVEVIVVDNGSSDGTPAEVGRAFGGAVRYIRQANRGAAAGYNAGFALAAGELIQFLDGDDFLAPNKIEKQVVCLREDPEADIAYGDVRQFQSAAGRAAWLDWDTRQHADILHVLLAPDGRGAGLVIHSVLHRRRAIERVGGWDESIDYVADQDYWLRAAWAGCRFRYTPGALCLYRRRAGQQTSGEPLHARAMARNMAAVWTKAVTYIDREPYRTMAARYLARLQLGLAVTEPALSREEALASLRQARDLEPAAVPPWLYQAAHLIVRTPGGRPLARSRALNGLRRAAGRLLGVEG